MSAEAQLAADFEHCRRITADRAKSFALGIRLAPRAERDAMHALYAWNRLGDDIADDPGLTREQARSGLDRFASDTRCLLAGSGSPDEPMWRAMSAVIRRHGLRADWLQDLIAGLYHDASGDGIQDRAGLDRYCSRVAGSVGKCCVAIWGVRDAAQREHAFMLADRLGRAFQITNILRDIGEDDAMSPSRCYIPVETLRRAGLTAKTLVAWDDDARCSALIREHAERARADFDAGRELAELIPVRLRPTLWAMSSVYERTLDLIERVPRRAVSIRHVRPGSLAKLSIACRAVAMSTVG